jgi:hypothetical protein
MVNYQILEKYIEYYYTLSYIGNTFNTLNSSNLSKHVNIAYEVLHSLRTLKDGDNSSVVIDNDFRTLALSLISDYRQYTTNRQYHAMLDDISNDLNAFAGKTRSQVLTEIQ